jgi:cytochrome o ubiquinol oxidase operon protein cyoD
MSPVPASHGSEAPGHDGQGPAGSLRGYLTGFALAALLTIAAFWLVMGHVFESRTVTIFGVLALAVVQIAVHIRYFLHLDTHAEEGWNMLAFIFSAVLVIIVLGASIWVMYHEDQNMMPRAAALRAVTAAPAATSGMPAMPGMSMPRQ